MSWSVLDLSSITDELIQLLKHEVMPASPAWTSPYGSITPFHITVNGAMPQAERDDATSCLLSLYLMHVSPDPYYRSAPFGLQNAQLNTAQPLSLNLYYLLTAYANKNYVHEQQAMGLAMRCFHEHAIIHKTITPPPPLPPMTEEYSITMEVQTADEMSRLWQAISAPLRLSTVYKVAIAFLTPTKAPKPAGPPPKAVELSVEPEGASGAPAGGVIPPTGLIGAGVRESFRVPPDASREDDGSVEAYIETGLALPGDALYVSGTGLDAAPYAHVYVSDRDGSNEHMVDSWRAPDGTPSYMRLVLPSQVGTADATHCPEPGLYAITVGSGPPNKVRSNPVDITIAARISGLTTPPELKLSGGQYTVNGAGFTTGKTRVFFGDQELALSGALGPGNFVVSGETSFSFLPPLGLPSARYDLGIRVNGIDSPPSWYVLL